MKENDNIDRIFRDGLLNRKVDYDASDWKNVEKMLNDQKNQRYFLYKFRYFLSAILALIISGFSIWYMNRDSQQRKMSVIHESTVSQNVTGSSIEDGKIEHTIIPEKEMSVQTTVTSTEDIKIVLPERSDQSKNIAPIARKSMAVKLPEQSVAAVDEIKVVKTVDQTEDVASDLLAPSVLQKIISEDEAILPSAGEKIVEEGTTNRQIALSISDETVVDKETPADQTIFQQSIEVMGSDIPAHPSSEATESKEEVIKDDKDKTAEIPAIAIASEQPILPGEPEPDLDKIRPHEPKYSGFRLVLTGGLTSSESSEGSMFKNQYTYGIGLGYEKLLRRNLSVEARVLISLRNAAGINYNVEEKHYDFGVFVKSSTYNYRELMYLEVPVILNYIVHSSHQVGLGLQYGRLISSSYSAIYEESGTTIGSNVTEGKGKHSPGVFSENDLSLLLSYQYMLTKRIKIGLMGQYGLTNMVNRQFIKDKNIDNHQARLQVTYKLFK